MLHVCPFAAGAIRTRPGVFQPPRKASRALAGVPPAPWRTTTSARGPDAAGVTSMRAGRPFPSVRECGPGLHAWVRGVDDVVTGAASSSPPPQPAAAVIASATTRTADALTK